MRVMVIIKASADSESGKMPSERLLREMGTYNEELVKAGIMVGGEGLHPTSKAKRLQFGKGGPTVVDGPFAETKELIAGYWLWQVKSMDEALAWAKRMPCTDDDGRVVEASVDIRPVFEAEDFGAEFTPELRAQEERLRATIASQHA